MQRINVFKKIVLALMLLALFFNYCLPVQAITYTDLKTDSEDYPYANYLGTKNLMVGYPDESFGPNKNITRAEMAVMLVEVEGIPKTSLAKQTFKDVKPEYWAYSAIETASGAGLLKGFSDGTFRPQDKVTRGQLCAFLLSLTKEPIPSVALPSEVQDVKAANWARSQIAAAIEAGLIQTNANGSFAPDLPATRAETARGLALMLTTSKEHMRLPLTGVLTPVKGKVTIVGGDDKGKEISAATSCGQGSKIATGEKSEAKLSFPDGSNILLKENTEIQIVEASGQSVLLKDGTPGVVIDQLEVKLDKGRIFGALATSYFFSRTESASESANGNAAVNSNNSSLKTFAASDTEKPKTPWWKVAASKRVRVKVDMPWGVAGVRGCFWSNNVAENAQTLSIAEGGIQDVQLTSGGQTVTLGTGLFSSVMSKGATPTVPVPMPETELKAWQAEGKWIKETVNSMDSYEPQQQEPDTAASSTSASAVKPADPITGLVQGLNQTLAGTVDVLGDTVGGTVGGLGDTVGGTLGAITSPLGTSQNTDQSSSGDASSSSGGSTSDSGLIGGLTDTLSDVGSGLTDGLGGLIP